MDLLFTINGLSALDTIVGWDIIDAICDNQILDKIISASALIAFSTMMLIIIKKISSGENTNIMLILREMYIKLLINATIFLNPITYKMFVKVYAGAVKNVYEEMFKEGIYYVQWSMGELSKTITEAVSIGIWDVFNVKMWAANIIGTFVSIIINLAMVVYWILASIVPIYVTYIIIIAPLIMSLWMLFDSMGKKVLKMYITGIMVMFFVGITMNLFGAELHYYVLSDQIKAGNLMPMILIGTVTIATAASMPMIMAYIFGDAILQAIGRTTSLLLLLTGVGSVGSFKLEILNMIRKKLSKANN